jgi:hypothetical protein
MIIIIIIIIIINNNNNNTISSTNNYINLFQKTPKYFLNKGKKKNVK